MKSFIRSSLVFCALAFSFTAQSTTINNVALELTEQIFKENVVAGNWKVGDTANFKVGIGGFINGTMVMAVKAYDANGLLLTQDMDLGFAGKQNCEILIDDTTGKTKKFTCGGQDQETGDPADMEVVEMKEESVTVPAGTFQSVYIKVLNKKDNTNAEQWINPKLIPVLGLIKMATESQLGAVSVELTSFKKM